TLVQGGGIGLDIVPAVRRIITAGGVAIEWDEHLAGRASIERGGTPIPDELLKSARETGVVLKTRLLPPLATSAAKDAGNYNVLFRHELGLFASIRPLKNLPALPARFQNVDILLIRELTEDLYGAIEHEIVPGVVQSIKVVTERASLRFFRFAFEYARANKRKTICCVHKANILKLGDGLFLEAFRTTARDFPDIAAKEIIVDNCCMQLVSKPTQFDVLVAGNLFGDIVSDLGAGLVGGISATHAINFGDGLRVFETFHGATREDIGANKANPLPLLLPAVDMLNAFGQKEAGARIMNAVGQVLTERRAITADLGGSSGTAEMADAIIRAMR
ncbi:MAG: isocitrate/isopropylmalate dehydrogenase family protein, partial [Candidatus Acidiferrum sp.]